MKLESSEAYTIHVQIDQADYDLPSEKTDFSRVAPNTRAIDDNIFQGDTTVMNFVSEDVYGDDSDEHVPLFASQNDYLQMLEVLNDKQQIFHLDILKNESTDFLAAVKHVCFLSFRALLGLESLF